MTEQALYSPWRQLRSLPDVIVGYPDDLPSGRAWWSPAHRVILIARGLSQRSRRCALAHELAHIDLDHSGVEDYPDGDRQDTRVHTAADMLAARRLISITRLGEALAWSQNLEEIADELWVDPELVQVRVAHLHPSERHYLRRRMAARDGDAE